MSEPEKVLLMGAGADLVEGELFEAAPQSPEAEERAGRSVVLVHEVFGLDPFTRQVARELAAEGYQVLAPDLYSREGLPGPAPSADDPAPSWDIDTIRAAAAGLSDRQAVSDVEGAGKELKRRGASKEGLVVMGFCRGGTLAFLAGCQSRRFQAVVDFYGRIVYPELSENQPVQPLEMLLNLGVPLIGHFGSDDPSIPADDVEALKQGLESSAKTFTLHTYEGGKHGFANPLRPAFDDSHSASAWNRTHRFLDEVL
ncbi:MAG: carboxymethylenebutenolidase [Planctomycetota bacterium]|jgi:carboxymethylenebutenolidase